MRALYLLLPIVLLTHCLLATPVSSQHYSVTVEAGLHDRLYSMVSFDLPSSLAGDDLALYTEEQTGIPLQQFDGKVWFILDSLKAGKSRVYQLKKAIEHPSEYISIHSKEGAFSFTKLKSPILTYQSKETALPRGNIKPEYKRGGYIHPVTTPSGVPLTDDYPRNHVHHHGIWAAWTKTEFDGRKPDFWNMGNKSGTVKPTSLDTTWTGAVFSGLKSRHAYIDLSSASPVTVLDESWEIRVYNVPLTKPRPYYIFDLFVVQKTTTDKPLHLPKYRYGGVGFRGHWDWNGAKNTFFLTSEGKNRSNGHATTAKWCHISGYVDDSLAGLAILSHPDNFRHPESMRIHPTEPFFNWAPSQQGDWSISPDAPFIATYRFVVMDGAPDAELFDRLWQDFATPPLVTLSSLN